MTTNNVNATSAIDKLSVMAKEKINDLNQYYTEIVTINNSLANAKASLENTPGVQVAVDAIDKSIKENYERGYNYQKALEAEQNMLLELQESYTKFANIVNSLEHPTPAQTQLKLNATPTNN